MSLLCPYAVAKAAVSGGTCGSEAPRQIGEGRWKLHGPYSLRFHLRTRQRNHIQYLNPIGVTGFPQHPCES